MPHLTTGCQLDRFALPVLMVFATLAGWLLRQVAGYPPAPSDERNWIAIAHEVSKGVQWPISGPLHFETTQALATWLDSDHATALAALGLASIPGVLLAYAVSFRLMGFSQAWPPLLLLCTSTYFWAPLLESRPQQWGQALVMLCSTSAWHLLIIKPLHKPWVAAGVWLGWCALLALTCCVHLLSGAIALAIGVMLALFVTLWRPDHLMRATLGLLATIPGVVVLGLPDGPYQAMWLDIFSQHLQFNLPSLWGPAIGAVLMCSALFVAMRTWAPKALVTGLQRFEAQPKRSGIAAVAFMLLTLYLQAILLPDEAWVFYQASALNVVARQVGNVLFLTMFAIGAVFVVCDSALRSTHPWPGQAALLGCAALLAFAALLASTVLLHTNWMLRIINYGLPFAAPFAAVGFWHWRLCKFGKFVALVITSFLSLMTAGYPTLV